VLPVALPTSESPRVSVIVLGWREAPYLLSCLESIARHCSGAIPFELLLFLNEPSDALRERVRQQVRGARVAESPINLGFGGGNNAAARSARGEFIVLLNDDAVVQPGWLEALVAAADLRPAAGAIGSRVLAWDGTIQEAGGQLWRDASVTPLGYGLPGDSSEFVGLRSVDFASGCSLLVRHETWTALDGFDERYFPAYYEDVDLCLRIRARGLDVLCAGRSAVRHRQGGSVHQRFKSFLLSRNAALLRAMQAAALESKPLPPEGLWVVREQQIPPEAAAVPVLDEQPVLGSAGTRALLLDHRVRLAYAGVLESKADAREQELLAQIDQLHDWTADLEQRAQQREADLRNFTGEHEELQRWALELQQRVQCLEAEAARSLGG